MPADGNLCPEHHVCNAQTAERGKCDLIFVADAIGIRQRDAHLAREPRPVEPSGRAENTPCLLF